MPEFILTTKEQLEQVVEEAVKKANQQTPLPKERADPYTKKEVMRLFKVALPTLDRWNRKGQLKSFKIGRRVYYNATDVHKLLDSKLV